MIFSKLDNGLYRYVVSGNEVNILGPDGESVLKASRNPKGGDWTEVEQSEWGTAEVLSRNLILARKTVDAKIAEVSKAYDASMIARVPLSDGNVFGPSKSSGTNPTYSLKNTIDLIKDGCEQAVYRGRTSITISDADNKEVVYVFDMNSSHPHYILPVVEIADFISIAFAAKQTARTSLMGMLEAEEFNFDEVNAINGEELYDGIMKTIIAGLK